MGMVTPVYWTAEQVRQLPDDGNRYEVVYGELLVTPSPRLPHQVIVTRLLVALHEYLAEYPVGVALTSPADISWGRSDVLVQPDVFVIPPAEARTGDWLAIRHVMLVAEVLSPSTARADRFTKRRRYQDAGVSLYWIVDGQERTVEVWTPGAEHPVMARDRVAWHLEGASRPFDLELATLFRPL